jgi:ADP-heptose:LPS heptosyltransferase
MEELINRDLENWKQAAPEYKFKRTVSITVGGGLGDQLCAEPVIRFIRKWYTKETTDIYIFTHWKRLFKHLEEDFIISDINGIIPNDVAVYHMETSPKMEQLIWRFISHPMTHPVDYIALSTMRRILADSEKDIHLDVYPEELEEVNQVITNPEEYILIHPGRGWESKTFPAKWWCDVTEWLSKTEKVAIIGKYIGDDQGYVDFEAPEGVLDLRDMLSVGGLIALISKAKGVVTNDSAPVHIAGAFDNMIYLIPSCKHPDNVLPYRHGNKYYKAKAIYNKLTCDAIESLPTSTKDVTVDIVVGKIEDYLPTPEKVVEEILGGING